MNKLRYILLLGLPLFLSGCHFAILNPKGPIAAQESHLLIIAVLLMLTIVVPVIVASLVIAWRYRASNTKAAYTPKFTHSTWVEILMWTIPCIIIGILSVMTWISTHALDPYKPLASKKKPLIIEAVALEWKWLFIYPEQRIATVNFVQIPVNVPVRFKITSDAPMNSLEIPQLAGQIYAMTGMQTKLNLMATEPGTYKGLSTNFSGNGFSSMTFKVKAGSEAQFLRWVSKVKHSPKKLTPLAYKKLRKPSEKNPVAYYSSSKRGIFTMAIMKYRGTPRHKVV